MGSRYGFQRKLGVASYRNHAQRGVNTNFAIGVTGQSI